MNGRSFHVPRQSFPMDVTSPTPTQLPSSKAEESGDVHIPPPPKPPKPAEGAEEGQNDRGQIATPSPCETLNLF